MDIRLSLRCWILEGAKPFPKNLAKITGRKGFRSPNCVTASGLRPRPVQMWFRSASWPSRRRNSSNPSGCRRAVIISAHGRFSACSRAYCKTIGVWVGRSLSDWSPQSVTRSAFRSAPCGERLDATNLVHRLISLGMTSRVPMPQVIDCILQGRSRSQALSPARCGRRLLAGGDAVCAANDDFAESL